jgi:trigger factor
VQVFIENTSQLGRKITVSIPKETVSAKVQKELNTLMQKMQLPGFKAGKTHRQGPVLEHLKKTVEKKYGNSVRSDVLKECVHESFVNALEQHKWPMVGNPHFHVEPLPPVVQADLEYSATFEVFPEAFLKPFSELVVEQIITEITPENVAKTVEKVRDQISDWKVVERAAQMDDRLHVNLERTFLEGKGKPEQQENTYILLKEDGSNLPGLIEGLLGKIPSEEPIELTLEYPASWRHSEGAGQKIILKIKLLDVSEKEPLSDADFLTRLNQGDTLEAVTEKMKQQLEKEAARKIFEEVKEKTLEVLLAAHAAVTLPQSLVDQEVKGLHHKQHDHAPGEACAHEEPEHDCAEHQKEARDRVLLGMLVKEIITTRQIALDHAKVKEELGRWAQSMRASPEMLQGFLKHNPRLMENIQHQVLVDQAVAEVLKEATITPKTLSFTELMAL